MDATRRGRALGPGRIDRAKVATTTEEDTRRHMAEDGLAPENPLAGFRDMVSIVAVRKATGLSQDKFAAAIGVPAKTLRNWEQGRSQPDPVVRSLFSLIGDHHDAAFDVIRPETAPKGDAMQLSADDLSLLERMRRERGLPTGSEVARIKEIERKLRAARFEAALGGRG